MEGVKNLICPLSSAHGATVRNKLIYETIIVQLTARRVKSQIGRTESLLSVSLSQTPSLLHLVTGITETREMLAKSTKRSFFFVPPTNEKRENVEHKMCVKPDDDLTIVISTAALFHLGTSMLLKRTPTTCYNTFPFIPKKCFAVQKTTKGFIC